MAEGFHDVKELWLHQGEVDAQNNRDLRHQHGNGPYNIIILDTSSYIGEEGMNEMKETFATMINEYAKHPEIDENIAVIVCGKHTKFQRYFSNQYEDIVHCLDYLEFGGPCPLTAAFLLAYQSLRNGTRRSYIMNDYHVHPRLILMSAGRSTDFTLIDYVDSPRPEQDDNELLSLSREMGRVHPIFCIPLGRSPNLTTLGFISGQSRGGKIVYSNDAAQLAKYSSNMKIASRLQFTMNNDGNDKERILTSLVCTFPDRDFTETDQKDICEICLLKRLYRSLGDIFNEIDDEDDIYKERDSRMPPLGSRVNRGRDWKWGDLDRNGSGTVVGHQRKVGWLRVQWDRDSDIISSYRYGSTHDEGDTFDVKMCDEPRILENEIIAVGCLVTRGQDWHWDDQDGGEGNIGSVVRVRNCGLILVRWTNGNMKEYRYGYHGEIDLRICEPFSSETKRFLKNQMESLAALLYYRDRDFDNVYVSSKRFNTASKETAFADSNEKPLLSVCKGKYFKNKCENSNDIETDGMKASFEKNQWFWKDVEGNWNLYSKEMNDRVNKCFKRDPKSTVIVTIQGHTYRVVMAKRIQINLMTRKAFEVKLVINEPVNVSSETTE